MNYSWLEPGHYTVNTEGRAVKTKAPSNTGKVLQGYAFRFNELFWHDDKWKCILDGAFDETLNSDHVRMLLEHNDALEFGDSKSNLIIHTDKYGVAFRCHLRNDPISFQVRALAESKAFLDCSIGFSFSSSQTTTRIVCGREVQFIHKDAAIQEISFLKAGACPQTNALIADMKDCGPLFVDCKSSRFIYDNKYTEVIRQLRNLENA